MKDIQWPAAFFIVVFFLSSEIGVSCLLAYLLFCKQTFYLEENRLIMKSQVFGFTWRKIIPKISIDRFIKFKDSGPHGRSWGLKIEGRKKNTLIFQQPYEKVQWLGDILAQWADVEFTEKSSEIFLE
ncbi:MAG: hypothetical protein D3911_12540 [Candidatus Electrothrix sp. AW3_4]|nr:hypothetical protein [Candidatus Electrothrix gigas]